MGPYLTVPRKEKDSVDGETPKVGLQLIESQTDLQQYKYGATGMQGWRNTMEDSHIAEVDLGNGVSFFGVYDGHGGTSQHSLRTHSYYVGHEVAQFVKEHLVGELKTLASFQKGDYEQCLKDIYLRIDEMVKTSPGKEKLQTYKKQTDSTRDLFGRQSEDIANSTGCTACSALLTPTELYIANAGDSRAVLAKKTGTKIVAHELSVDHKPELAEERKRIEKAGGFVEDNRVRGILNLSRSLGDLEYKSDSTLHLKDQMITALPDIRKEKIGADTQFLILACDGIWDCLTSQEAVELVADLLQKKPKVSGVIEEMFDRIIASDVASSGGIGCDNMTCVIIQFKH